MDKFIERFPTRDEWKYLFISYAFVVNLWSIIQLLNWMPAFILRLRGIEIVSIIAYILGFALIESLLLLGFSVFIGVVSPGVILRDHWLIKSVLLFGTTALWAAVYHLLPDILLAWKHGLTALAAVLGITLSQEELLRFTLGTLVSIMLTLFLGSYFITLRRIYRLIARREAYVDVLYHRIKRIIERLEVLTYFYVSFDVLGLVIVLFRNLTG
jgi:hypothetical protein